MLAFSQVPSTVVPTTVVLDRSGRVAVAFRKVVDPGELEPFIRGWRRNLRRLLVDDSSGYGRVDVAPRQAPRQLPALA